MVVSRSRVRRSFVVVLCMTTCTALAQEAALPNAKSASQTTETKKPAEPPQLMWPEMHLTPITGFDDDDAYRTSIEERAADLHRRATKAPDARQRVDLLLAAANLTLAHYLEPDCTMVFLVLRQDPTPDIRSRTSAALDRADKFLSLAEESLEGLTAPDKPPPDWMEEAGHRLATLRIFAGVLRAFFSSGDDPDGVPAARRAASRLSPLLEDKDRTVVAAATFWQGCLRGMGGNPERVLSILEPALSDPPRDSMPYGFFARLLRCRLVARGGGSVAALAILLQIEERCYDWMTSDAERDQAVRAAEAVRLGIMFDWHARLDADAAEERAWCVKRANELIKRRFADLNSHVLRLAPAIPLVAPIPDEPGPQEPPAPDGG